MVWMVGVSITMVVMGVTLIMILSTSLQGYTVQFPVLNNEQLRWLSNSQGAWNQPGLIWVLVLSNFTQFSHVPQCSWNYQYLNPGLILWWKLHLFQRFHSVSNFPGLFRTLNPAMQELDWAMPHSDFSAWLSSATLTNFISVVSGRILMW